MLDGTKYSAVVFRIFLLTKQSRRDDGVAASISPILHAAWIRTVLLSQFGILFMESEVERER